MKHKPNILFLMSDEHRPDVAGFAGNRIVRTPVLDKLAATGTIFTNAYTPSPICIPARQCIMSGQLPRTCGCEKYGQDLQPGYMTYARQFALHGYETVVSGKLHHLGTDQMQGWTARISGDIQLDPHYIGGQALSLRKPFSQAKWSDAKEVTRAGIGRGPCVTHDEYAVQGAKQFIEQYFCSPYYDREQSQPLLLKVSLLQPHYPYFTSEDKFNYYLNRVDPYTDEEVSDHPFLSQRQIKVGIDAAERDLRRATAAYYGMIETIDGLYGEVLEALEHAGQNIDEWIIIYTSDHGEMLGQHGIWEKQKFYEASCRVPLIIRYPQRFPLPQSIDQNVNLCDLFATLTALAELPLPPGLDSRSLVPLMEGDDALWDHETISQFAGTNLMIKSGSLKYQYYGEQMPEVLFDLDQDPGETRNCIDDPELSAEVARFRRRRAELGFGIEADPNYCNAGYNRTGSEE